MKNVITYDQFIATVHYDDDDEIFVGKIINIEDNIRFHGTTIAELKEGLKEASEDYVAYCESVNKPVFNKTAHKVVIDLPQRLNTVIHKSAAVADVEVEVLIVDTLNKVFCAPRV